MLNRLRLPTSYGVLKLYENNVRSLLRLKQSDEDWCFCVADYDSDDMNVTEFFELLQHEYLQNGVQFDYKLSTHKKETFTRGGARNQAYALAPHDTVFFLDADMLFSDRDVIDNTYTHVADDMVYFPICASFADHTHKTVYKRETGKGNIALSKKTYELNTQGWWEKKTWGKEDDKMYEFYDNLGKVVRDFTKTFYHQWHPKHQ
jgi:hypothetical protein